MAIARRSTSPCTPETAHSTPYPIAAAGFRLNEDHLAKGCAKTAQAGRCGCFSRHGGSERAQIFPHG
jgi:hypothetical protein